MSSAAQAGKAEPPICSTPSRGSNRFAGFRKAPRCFNRVPWSREFTWVESGEVRVLLPNSQHEKQLLEVVGPETMLGLSENMSGETYRVTAEARDRATVSFIPRENFIEFLREHGDFSMQVVRLLSEDLHGLYQKFRNNHRASGTSAAAAPVAATNS